MTQSYSPHSGGLSNRRGSIRVTLVLLLAGSIIGWVGCRPRADDRPTTPTPEFTPPVETPPSGPPWFADVTASSGLDFTYRNGQEAGLFTLLETLGGGVALLDYDGDGRLDVFLTGGGYFETSGNGVIKGYPCKLYRNLGNFQFTDVTATVRLDTLNDWYSHGAAVADYDRDGYPDLVVTGYGHVALFHNEPDGKGGRVFMDVTGKLKLKDHSWATSAGWGDLDGDGWPDLYVCHYSDWSLSNNPVCNAQNPGIPRDVCTPQRFKPLVHALLRNEGGKTFRDVSAEQRFEARGYGLGVVLVDVNDDGQPDIYVGNDATNNFLFMNRGGKLEEKGLLAGVAVNEEGHFDGSMGVDAGDYEGSGRPSLWVTNFQGDLHGLYKNLGRERFLHVSRATGMGSLGQHLVGFGTAFLDADHDGWEDLAIAHGHVLYHPLLNSPHKQLPMLLRNVDRNGRRFFQSLGSSTGPYFQRPVVGRGLAVGDLNNDGWPDLILSHTNSPVAVLKNVVAEHAPARWVGLRLVGRENRDVVGSTVVVETDARTLTKFAKGGGSYLSANDPRFLFGLGSSGSVKRVTVKWSWGKSQTWDGLEAGVYWELAEGVTAARKLAMP